MRSHSGLLGHFVLTHGIVDQKSPNFAPWALLGASGVIVYGEPMTYILPTLEAALPLPEEKP